MSGNDETKKDLEPIINGMKKNLKAKMTIYGNSGYEDDGSSSYQVDDDLGTVKELMIKRAEKVKQLFVENGISADRIETSYGTSSNDAYVNMSVENINVENVNTK